MSGTIYGIGLGPGDPDLISVKAHRLLSRANHIAYFRKAGRPGQARTLAAPMMPEGAIEHPMEYPVTTEIAVSDPCYNQVLSDFYGRCVGHLKTLVSESDVVVLCEGDPFFYGSFMHIYERLKGKIPIEVVPAITGMSAAWTATGHPITWGDDVMTVLMGTLDEDTLVQQMSKTDALVVMKIGRNFSKVVNALRETDLFDRAWLVEYASMDKETVQRLRDVDVGYKAPYFSIIVVHGQGRRP